MLHLEIIGKVSAFKIILFNVIMAKGYNCCLPWTQLQEKMLTSRVTLIREIILVVIFTLVDESVVIEIISK